MTHTYLNGMKGKANAKIERITEERNSKLFEQNKAFDTQTTLTVSLLNPSYIYGDHKI